MKLRTLASRRKVAVAIATLVGVLAGGTSLASAATVPTDGLFVTTHADHTSAGALRDGATVTNQHFVFVKGLQGSNRVQFFIDGSNRPVTIENVAPYDLGTTGAQDAARSFDFQKLGVGTHTVGFTATANGKVKMAGRVRVKVAAPTPTTVKPTTTTVKPTTTTVKPTSTTVKPTTTTVPPTTTTAAPATSGRILFEDDFNGPTQSAPDASKWVDYGSWCKTPEGVTVDQPGFGYISCDTKKYLDGSGNLVLPATPQQGSGVQTATKFGFVYGEASAWMKMPKQAGYWPAFWTLNGLNQKRNLVGEADITEYYSTWNGTYHAVTHSWGSTPTAAQPGGRDNFCTMGVDLTEGFHKYSARFEPGKITYLLDDKVCTTEVASSFTQWPFGPNNMSENWLILDNAIGGAGGAQTPATQNSQVLVSRVEVRAL